MKNGAPGGIRTPDQQDRNLLLYPAELQAHNGSVCGAYSTDTLPVCQVNYPPAAESGAGFAAGVFAFCRASGFQRGLPVREIDAAADGSGIPAPGTAAHRQ